MRNRRGNYMIMFAMLLPILLGFLAFSIDLGRLRVARIQAQNAADAAAVAALAELRDGGSFSSALSSAQVAANAIRLQRITSPSTGSDFLVDVQQGDFTFEGYNWSDRNTSSGVTVNVSTNQPLGLLFAPVFEGRGFGFGQQVYEGGEDSVSAKDIVVGRRASFRPRDIVLVIDTSRAMTDHLTDVRAALRDFVDTVADFGVPEDRIGVVEFAGAARTRMSLRNVRQEQGAIEDQVRDVRLCRVGVDAWYHFYRFFQPNWDTELNGFIPYAYNAVGFPAPGDDTLYTGWEVDSQSAIDFQTDFADIGPDQDSWTFPITPLQACALTYSSYLYFRECDPRRNEVPGDCEPMEMSDLDCHAGNYWDNRDDRWEFDFSLPEFDCLAAGVDYVNPYGDVEAYGEGNDGVPGMEAPDRSFVQAGTNPNAGLLEAMMMFEGSFPMRSEATVVLITASAPECGPLIDPADAPTCVDDWLVGAYGTLESMSNVFRANTHVVGLVEEDSIDELVLSTFTTGRGAFLSTEDDRDLPALLDEVARDIKIQMVD